VSVRGPAILVAAAAVAAAALLSLSACTAPDDHSPASSRAPSAASSSTGASQLPVKDAIKKIMAKGSAFPVLGTSDGTLNGPGEQPVKLVTEVLQVRASQEQTLVVWRLKSATDQTVLTTSFQLAHPPLTDTRLLGIVDPKTKTTYRPYTYVPIVGNGEDSSCLCSKLPEQIDGSGEILYAVVPPLPKAVKSVDVTLPGFETISGIRVERSEG
jgi:hypothetical protein